jgi:release factor glutamine methyltransferase
MAARDALTPIPTPAFSGAGSSPTQRQAQPGLCSSAREGEGASRAFCATLGGLTSATKSSPQFLVCSATIAPVAHTQAAPITISQTLARAHRHLDAIDARVLLQHALGVDRAYLVTHERDALSAAQAQRYHALVARRAAGEPVAYLTGEREFYGLKFRVMPDVLIPRPETELVVDIALAKLAPLGQPALLDLGTGSGAIAIAVAALRADADVVAVDSSRAALVVAQHNARTLLGALAARVKLCHSDWYAGLGDAPFDIIAANPPYIAAGDAHLTQGDLRFEPQQALIGGEDGLAAIRAIVEGAAAHLKPDGWLILEHGYDQAEPCRDLLRSAGFKCIESALDLARIERVTFAQRG